MLSGIGPSDHLKALNVAPIIANLPVGRNLMDNPIYNLLQFTTNQSVSPPNMLEDIRALLRDYGPYTSTGIEAVAFYQSSRWNVSGTPDLEVLLDPGYSGDRTPVNNYVASRVSHYRSENIQAIYGPETVSDYKIKVI